MKFSQSISKILALGVASLGLQLFCVSTVIADGMPPTAPKKKSVKAAPRYVPPVEQPRAEPPPPRVEPVAEVAPPQEHCGMNARLSAGVSTWFFNEENTLAGPGAYLDVWDCDYPINFHMGIEGRHMYLGQDAADFAREFPDKTTRVTYLRIPFALEYMHPLSDDTTLYVGGGPDIIHTANDLEDTNVGLHLSSRLHYAIDKNIGVGVEAGYMWGDVDGEGEDVELDNAFITPTLAYTF